MSFFIKKTFLGYPQKKIQTTLFELKLKKIGRRRSLLIYITKNIMPAKKKAAPKRKPAAKKKAAPKRKPAAKKKAAPKRKPAAKKKK
ncbi:MAG: hypothetical protein UU89_C0024G0018 [Parcubacteria group bacterium GW2011_GWC2_42_11]|nr:MAG: hypothetical protein UU89_C0024G0018 [Parcubacteria group bacterium GW2011_GWC2_42_11]